MKQRKPNGRFLCCASIFALFLSACSQQGGKVKSDASLSENAAAESTAAGKSRIFHISRKRGAISIGANGKPKYDNLWDRLFDLYAFPEVEHQDIERELNWFINHPSYIERVQERAEPFLYSIILHIEKQHVPGEIALLPVIESAFQPHAISPANAAGLWQFIPATGKNYGLKKSRSYDGRRDVYASTRAAVKYLKKLRADFNGDWLLAVAAYNCGEGAVSRAIQKNAAKGLPTDFWSLDLPQETRSYVPRLLAVSRLFVDSERYGIDLRPIPNKALYRAVRVKDQLDLALAADAADISLNQLIALNPGFKGQYADVDGSYHLYVPANKSKGFKEELARLVQEQAVFGGNSMQKEVSPVQDELEVAQSEEHTVSIKEKSRSDTTHVHAKKAQSRDDEPGTSVKVVHKLRGGAEDDEALNRKQAKAGEPDKKAVYTVRNGDTLYSIARSHSVGVDDLTSWNKLSKKNGIRPGMTLSLAAKDTTARKLPLSVAGAGIRSSQSIKYTVRQGDSIFAISKRFNVSVAELRKWNGPRADKQFKPGVNLTVAADRN